MKQIGKRIDFHNQILDSIVVSIPACHAGDRGSIPRRGDFLIIFEIYELQKIFMIVELIQENINRM